MIFDYNNFKDSPVYKAYRMLYTAKSPDLVTFNDHSPYKMLENLLTYKAFKNYALDNISN